MGFRAALVAIVLAACGSSSTPPPARHDDASPIRAAAPPPRIEIAPRPLGMPDLASFGWRKRAGQVAFRAARKAEMKDDWQAVVATCKQVLAADPGHLEAAWLLAAGLAETGRLDEILAPLQLAAAGDFGKWGNASLELPAMQKFLATPAGEAWRRRVEADRAQYTAVLARSLIVTAGGDLYAIDLEANRWHRLTRTGGAVIGVLAAPSAKQLGYLARVRVKGRTDVGLGIIDLGKGKSSRPVPLGATGPLALAYSAQAPAGFWIGTGAPKTTAWRQMDADYHLHPVAAKARPPGPWLALAASGAARLHALAPNVTADWDEQGLASAIRIGTSNRIVSVPSPGLIDGDTATWSPDRSHLAFVAQLDDHCAAGSVSTAAFVADAATGQLVELERAAGGLAVAWVADRKLAVAGDKGVSIASLDGGAVAPIEGATGLVVGRERPRCVDEPTLASPEEEPDSE